MTSPASSRASKTVTALRARCSAFIWTIASRIACLVPTARIAPKDERNTCGHFAPRTSVPTRVRERGASRRDAALDRRLEDVRREAVDDDEDQFLHQSRASERRPA